MFNRLHQVYTRSTPGLHQVYTTFLAGTKKPQQVRLRCENLVEFQQVIDGAQGRGRTGMEFSPRDFKFSAFCLRVMTNDYFWLLSLLLAITNDYD